MKGRGGRQGGRGRHSGAKQPSSSSSVPCTVLTLHQPLASMLAYGLQRLDGRTWSTKFRGPLWIHAAAKQPEPEEIEYWQEVYGHIFKLDGEGEPKFPPCYPTSALVGIVEMVDCVSAAEFATWDTLPHGARAEAGAHGQDFYLLVQQHQRLMLPLKMPGQHKLWQLDHSLASSLWEGGLRPSETMAISWNGHRQAAEARLASEEGGEASSCPPTVPTPAMKRNARRSAAAAAAAAADAAAANAVATDAAAAASPPEQAPAAASPLVLRYFDAKSGTLHEVQVEDELGGHLASASSPAVAEFQHRLAAASLAFTRRLSPEQIAHSLGRPLEWAQRWGAPLEWAQRWGGPLEWAQRWGGAATSSSSSVSSSYSSPPPSSLEELESRIPRPRSLPDWLPTSCFRDVELRRAYLEPPLCAAIFQALMAMPTQPHDAVTTSTSGGADVPAAARKDFFWMPAHYLKRTDLGELEVATDRQGTPVQANTRLQAAYTGGLPSLDRVLARMYVDFHVEDASSRILLNRYDTGEASIATHRHDFWSALLSLGDARVFLLDGRPMLLRAGDVLAMGTQKHGVPRQPSTAGPRISIAIFFEPPRGAEAQRWQAATTADSYGGNTSNADATAGAMIAAAEAKLAAIRNAASALPHADLSAEVGEAQAGVAAARSEARRRHRQRITRKLGEVERLVARQAAGEVLQPNQRTKLGQRPALLAELAELNGNASRGRAVPAAVAAVPAALLGTAARSRAPPPEEDEEDTFDSWMLAEALELAEAESAVDLAISPGAVVGELELEAEEIMVAAAVDEGWATALVTEEEEAARIAAMMTPMEVGLDPVLSAKVEELTRMGFDRAHASEMLQLSGGDLEAAVALLCS